MADDFGIQRGLGGFATALGSYADMKRRQRENTPIYSAADFGISNAPADFKVSRAEALSLLKGGNFGGGYTLGDIVPALQGTPQGSIPVGAKAAPGLAVQGMAVTKPTAEEAKGAAETQQLANLGKQLASRWKESGFGTGETGEAVRGVAAALLPGQIAQRTAGPQFAKYENTKSLLSETALRVATGAAAPEEEKRQYAAYLPTPGDTPEIAAGKVDDFFNRLQSKAESKAQEYEMRGLPQLAAQHRASSVAQLSNLRRELAGAFGQAPGRKKKYTIEPLP